MLPDLVSRESERRAMRDEKIAEREEEIKALRARCARLRAALAGVLRIPPSQDCVGKIDGMLADIHAERDRRKWTYWETRARIDALHVLRETAGEGKA